MDYKNYNIIITGAAGGIGRELVRTFHKLNAHIIGIDIDPVKLRSMKNIYTDRFDYKTCDLRDSKQLQQILTQLNESYNVFHILINCAGISMFKDFLEISVDEWDETLAVNLRAPFIISQFFSKKIQNSESSYGRIINIASTRATMSEPGSEAYASSKGGIVALTHAMAISLSELPITVNSISPGWIEIGDYDSLEPNDHEQHPSRRVGMPRDVANTCLYLCNPENDFINGQNIVIDGGMTKKMIYT